jgi:hypothetical protein
MQRVQLLSILASVGLLALVIELVRSRKLREEYSLLWLLVGAVLLVFSLQRGLLRALSRLMGVAYSPSALLLTGFILFIVVLLHFSVIVSSLSRKNTSLAQRLAILDWKLREMEKKVPDLPREEPGSDTPPTRTKSSNNLSSIR